MELEKCFRRRIVSRVFPAAPAALLVLLLLVGSIQTAQARDLAKDPGGAESRGGQRIETAVSGTDTSELSGSGATDAETAPSENGKGAGEASSSGSSLSAGESSGYAGTEGSSTGEDGSDSGRSSTEYPAGSGRDTEDGTEPGSGEEDIEESEPGGKESGEEESGDEKSGEQGSDEQETGEKEKEENKPGKDESPEDPSGAQTGEGEKKQSEEDEEKDSSQQADSGEGDRPAEGKTDSPGNRETDSFDPEEKTEKGTVPGVSEKPETVPAAGEDRQGNPAPGAGTGAAAGSTQESSAAAGPEEDWMTASEFRRAYNSVSGGASALAASSVSGAKIVSKEGEIDYEELGIGEEESGHVNHTTPINVRDQQGNDYTGVCVVPDDRGWPKGTVLPDVRRVTDSVMIKLYYYTMLDGYGEDLARSRGYGSSTRKVAIAACHEAMSMRYAELAGIEYDRPNLNGGFRSLVSAYRSGASSKSLPDQDRVFIYISGRVQNNGHWMQAYVFGLEEEEEEEQPSTITLIKTSSDPDMRNVYSDYYCLHETASGGTVDFRLYEDRACTKRVHVYTGPTMTVEIDPIQVGHNGKSGLWNQSIFYCAPGTYYLKEVNTPKGYSTRTEPFGPFTLTEGKGITVKAENTPRYAKAGVMKKDAETGQGLAGAKFGLYSDIEDARNEADPEGVFTTGSDGKSNLIDVLAGKTYYVRELSAPKGYKAITGIRTLTVASSVTQTVWTEIANTPDEPEKGSVQIMKKPADPKATGSPYSLAGAVYTLYDKDGKTAGTLRTGEDGSSNVLKVVCGSYTLKETSASPGFELDTKTYNVTVRKDEITLVESSEPPRKGTVQVKKKSADPGASGSPYSLAGAVYTLYDKDGKSAGTLRTGEDGTSNVLTVLCGSYTLAETSASPCFMVETRVHNVTVRADTLTLVESSEPPEKGTVQVKKKSADPEASGDLYSLAGAEYTLYDKDGKSAGTLKTRADGSSNVLTVLCGSYTLRETSSPSGFELDTKTYNVTVRPALNTVVDSEEVPRKGKITVHKVSSEEKDKKEPDTMPVAGAVYSLYTTEEDAREGTGETGTFVIREDGTSDTLEVLAGRTYYIRETKTPEGYLPDEEIYRAEVTSFTETVTVESEDRLIFGGVRVCKLDRETKKGAALGGACLEGAVFKIWNGGTGLFMQTAKRFCRTDLP